MFTHSYLIILKNPVIYNLEYYWIKKKRWILRELIAAWDSNLKKKYK